MRYAITHGLQTKPEPGARVQLSETFLDATKQKHASAWSVVACDCELCISGRLVAVNEPSLADTPEPRPQWRHISYRNLERIVIPPGAVLSDEDAPPTRPQ